MNRRMDRRQQGRRQPGRAGVDRMGPIPRGTYVNHTQQALMRSHLAPSPLDHINPYMELARQGIVQGPASRGPSIPAPGPAIPLLSSGQGFYTVESLQGATSVSQGIPPAQSHFVGPERARVMGFGTPGVRQSYDSGMSNMHMMMNPMLSHEMLANGHSHPGSPLVAITPRPQQGLLGPVFANGPPQHPHLSLPIGFHPGRPSPAPGLLPGWPPQERDHGQGWGWDRDGGRDVKGDWNHRQWEGHRDSRQVERAHPHGRKARTKRNKQPAPAAKQNGPTGHDKKRKFPNALGPGGPGWCTLCELECSTAEMLQQHRHGKRHKRHLQSLELEGGKEKANSCNSSVNVVTSQGDVSNGVGAGPSAQQDGADAADKQAKEDPVESAEPAVTTSLEPPPPPPTGSTDNGSPELLEVESGEPSEEEKQRGEEEDTTTTKEEQQQHVNVSPPPQNGDVVNDENADNVVLGMVKMDDDKLDHNPDHQAAEDDVMVRTEQEAASPNLDTQ